MICPRPRLRGSQTVRSAVVAGLLTLAFALVAPAAHAALERATTTVPSNNRAYIFDTFGHGNPAFERGRNSLTEIGRLLKQEHYDTELIQGSKATLQSFVSMAGAGVIVFNTHGSDPDIVAREGGCGFAKGLVRAYVATHPADEKVEKKAEESCNKKPLLVVQTFTDLEGVARAFDQAIFHEGYSPDWVGAFKSSDGLYELALYPEGIEHFFAKKPSTLIYGSSCFSMSFASSFDAAAYFGYPSTAFDCETATDGNVLFGRLVGHEGVALRDSTAAYNRQGFPSGNQLRMAGTKNVVLSPAVFEPVDPEDGSVLEAGTSTDLRVVFDTPMVPSDPASLISISGCGATISGGTWQAGSQGETITGMINVPDDAKDGQMTVTIDNTKAVASGSPDPNNLLSGNQPDPEANGFEPNGNNYVWHLNCKQEQYRVHVDYTGTLYDSASGSSMNLTFDENRDVTMNFVTGVVTQAPVALTASGSIASGPDSCTIGPGSDPNALALGVGGVQSVTTATTSGSTTDLLMTVEGEYPTTLDPPVVVVSGSGFNCYSETADGLAVAPASFYHPQPGGGYDPGNALAAAEGPYIQGVNLVSLPLTRTYPFDFTVTGPNGFSDHVSGSATLTVTLLP